MTASIPPHGPTDVWTGEKDVTSQPQGTHRRRRQTNRYAVFKGPPDAATPQTPEPSLPSGSGMVLKRIVIVVEPPRKAEHMEKKLIIQSMAARWAGDAKKVTLPNKGIQRRYPDLKKGYMKEGYPTLKRAIR